MIDPTEVRRRCERLYPRFLQAWLRDEPFFPRALRGVDLAVRNLSAKDAIEAVVKLRDASKEKRGWGYAVEWKERSRGRDARLFGHNLFPQRIVFENADDFLRLIGKEREFNQFAAAARQVRENFPTLLPWLQKHAAAFLRAVPHVDALIEVVRYFLSHPRPGVFARELPLSTDTKFIESHEAILRQWLDIVLPPAAIAMEERFALRFGLREIEPHRLLRALDDDVRRRLGLPWTEISLPTAGLASLPVHDLQIIIVENKVNLLTLPARRDALALHGQGKDAATLRRLPWLRAARIVYWGDLDVDGLEILSQLRGQFPQTESLWMDLRSLERWQRLLAPGNNRRCPPPPHLTSGEQAAFERCSAENVRLEQERIPQSAVVDYFRDSPM